MQLSSFLWMGNTLAILSLSGNIPVEKHWLIIRVSGSAICNFISLSRLLDKPSLPKLDLFFSFSIILMTSVLLIVWNLKLDVIGVWR